MKTALEKTHYCFFNHHGNYYITWSWMKDLSFMFGVQAHNRNSTKCEAIPYAYGGMTCSSWHKQYSETNSTLI